MTVIVKTIKPLAKVHVVENPKEEFKQAVLAGLSKNIKALPSKFFYDAKGSVLFDQITRHPDYYLTNCEIEILTAARQRLANLFKETPFNLIELGPGEGIKPQLLIDYFLQEKLDFTYIPIDISNSYLQKIVKEFNEKQPNLNLTAINSDFFAGLSWLTISSDHRNVLLFLGSSIGNYNPQQTSEFLNYIRNVLHPGDYFLIGFDLRKDTKTLLRAYNDSDGITSAFNLNLLQRINQELQGNFKLDKFQHYGTYNVYSGAMESYILSLKNQMVVIKELNKSFYFQESEAIHVEFSYKFLLSQIELMAEQAGFEIVEHFNDDKHYFVDSLWQVKG